MRCKSCGAERRLVPCPDGRAGCAVVHYSPTCDSCERTQAILARIESIPDSAPEHTCVPVSDLRHLAAAVHSWQRLSESLALDINGYLAEIARLERAAGIIYPTE